MKENGVLIICSAVRTDFLEKNEMNFLCQNIGLNPETLNKTELENYFNETGFKILESESTSDIKSKYFEYFSEVETEACLKLAKLIRNKEMYIKEFGKDNYNYLRAYLLWNIYLLIGKIEYYVWLLKK